MSETELLAKSNVSSRTTSNKALRINLDEKKYGTIAEIGAGQEVARHFFLAGAAAGTVAKTISAYDMQFSSRFFAYAATVAAKSFNRDNECHAWCGVRAQMYPGAEPSDIIIHVRMHDKTAEQQQYTLGIVGVNLIYAAYYYFENSKKIIDSLSDNLAPDRIEIDSIEFKGPYFEEQDNRAINLHLIRSWKTRAVIFKPDGSSVIPAEMLYKKNVLTIRGSFKPATNLNVDMIEQGLKSFKNTHSITDDNTIVLAEISLNDTSGNDLGVPEDDLIARVDLLNSQGYSVMISDYTRYFSLRAYFRQYTSLQIGIVLGMINVRDIFDEKKYEGVEGGILEGFGKLFPDNTRLFVYPEINENGELSDFKDIKVPDHLRYLYRHLLENKFIFGIDCSDKEILKIYSRDILKQLPNGTGEWENCVPENIAQTIIDNRYFGFKA